MYLGQGIWVLSTKKCNLFFTVTCLGSEKSNKIMNEALSYLNLNPICQAHSTTDITTNPQSQSKIEITLEIVYRPIGRVGYILNVE